MITKLIDIFHVLIVVSCAIAAVIAGIALFSFMGAMLYDFLSFLFF